jgi:quinol monooxygenase YgiN
MSDDARPIMSFSFGYGLATKAYALPGKHKLLIEVLEEVTRLVFNVPGCLSYVVSTVPDEPDAIFITEFWDHPESQRSAFAMAGIYEVALRFHALSTDIEQNELQPLPG